MTFFEPAAGYVFSGSPFSPLPSEGEGAGVRGRVWHGATAPPPPPWGGGGGGCRPRFWHGAPLTRPSATLSPKGRGLTECRMRVRRKV
jgi:hypothetical protein